MSLRPTLTALVLAAATLSLTAQTASPAPQKTPAAPSTQTAPAPAPAQTPSKRATPKPQAEQAPGAGPDKVWVNNKSNVYHCPSDRYYGRTKDGKYMTEADAKKAGAHGQNNETCFK